MSPDSKLKLLEGTQVRTGAQRCCRGLRTAEPREHARSEPGNKHWGKSKSRFKNADRLPFDSAIRPSIEAVRRALKSRARLEVTALRNGRFWLW